MVVTNPDGQQAILPNGFTITEPITSFTATPLTGNVPLTVHFTDTSTNSPTTWNWTFGDGNVTNATVQNPVHTYWIPGIYTVTLEVSTARGNRSLQKNNYITVKPLVPTIISLAPPGPWYRNATINYTITGTKFQPGNTVVTFQNKSGLYLNGTDAGVTSVTASTINGTIHVPYNAPVGAWNISITTVYGGPAWRDSAFTVQSFPKPVFTSITPAGPWNRNTTVNYTITGASFQPGNTVVTFRNKSGFYLNGTDAGVILATSTSINGSMHIPYDAPPGAWNISITTVDGGTTWKDSAITISSPLFPLIGSITPASGTRNSTVTFTLNGNNFRTENGYTTVSFVNGFTPGNVLNGTITSITSTRITGTLVVPGRCNRRDLRSCRDDSGWGNCHER